MLFEMNPNQPRNLICKGPINVARKFWFWIGFDIYCFNWIKFNPNFAEIQKLKKTLRNFPWNEDDIESKEHGCTTGRPKLLGKILFKIGLKSLRFEVSWCFRYKLQQPILASFWVSISEDVSVWCIPGH